MRVLRSSGGTHYPKVRLSRDNPERERRPFETLRAKYGGERRVLDFVSRIAGRIGRRVVLEVVLSGKNTASMITTPTSN
jgi:hypothetical protein